MIFRTYFKRLSEMVGCGYGPWPVQANMHQWREEVNSTVQFETILSAGAKSLSPFAPSSAAIG
jgi:hypothetical protein